MCRSEFRAIHGLRHPRLALKCGPQGQRMLLMRECVLVRMLPDPQGSNFHASKNHTFLLLGPEARTQPGMRWMLCVEMGAQVTSSRMAQPLLCTRTVSHSWEAVRTDLSVTHRRSYLGKGVPREDLSRAGTHRCLPQWCPGRVGSHFLPAIVVEPQSRDSWQIRLLICTLNKVNSIH